MALLSVRMGELELEIGKLATRIARELRRGRGSETKNTEEGGSVRVTTSWI